MRKQEIILGVTASIAIYKACDIIRRLQAEGFGVTVVMTQESTELIRPVVFSTLTGRRAYQDLFSDEQTPWEVEHIALADKADLVLVAPATANIIAKFATGLCDDLLTCLVSATKAKVLIAPAMNENMYKNKITQENIKKLQDLGYKFVGPKPGKLACGKVGTGCLADVEDVIKAVKKVL
ncbi:MAG: flavoprotein [Candidatus Omnitrophica bacterium]|nr:flavoprotein [Candidatus Omnitrophota bacterium]MDD5236361.1 flavoprotein [Candidatus Omnitrophota bacterium]